MILLLWSVMIFLIQAFRLEDLSKRKPEIQANHNCLQRNLRKDSNDSFSEMKYLGIFNET